MTRRHLLLVLLGFVAAGIAAVLVSCGATREQRPPEQVPASWSDVRNSVGHQVHVGKHHVACTACHGTDGFPVPPLDLCSRCHDVTRNTIHPPDELLGQPRAPQCRDCHGFGRDLSIRPNACMRCHQDAQGRHAAVGIHSDEDCSSCHRAHDVPSLEPQPCTNCHAAQKSSASGHAGIRGCIDCHAVHEARASAETQCATCHAKQRGAVHVDARAIDNRHTKCTTCHAPHKFAKTEVKPCLTCHANQPILAVAASKGRHTCAGCHDRHDTGTAKACTTCHARRTQHPPKGPAALAMTQHGGGASAACATCHPPHDAKLGTAFAVTCESCHAKQPRHATAKCRDCHDPHAPKPALVAALCTKCHADKARSTSGSGHAQCTGCHKQAAHQPSKPPPPCATCHAEQRRLTASNKGHADCTKCHGTNATHNPRAPRPACATCHKVEASTAPRGHQRCNGCHDTHSGARKPTAVCTTCHTDKPKLHHGNQNCANCHRPHGPKGIAKPPPCVSCHPAAKRPGLHRDKGHQDCANCHRSHEARPRDDRVTCTVKCHVKQQNHQPTAVRCATCHPFGPGSNAPTDN